MSLIVKSCWRRESRVNEDFIRPYSYDRAVSPSPSPSPSPSFVAILCQTLLIHHHSSWSIAIYVIILCCLVSPCCPALEKVSRPKKTVTAPRVHVCENQTREPAEIHSHPFISLISKVRYLCGANHIMLETTIQNDLSHGDHHHRQHHCHIQGNFFHWYPPKKFKYRKPRLGESTLT